MMKRSPNKTVNEHTRARWRIQMRDFNTFIPKLFLVVVIPIILSTGCGPGISIKKDPFYKSFYEKTRIIMTEEELKIYSMLPDKKSKQEFIEDFWNIRDPNPGTEENEAKAEFERRIGYANAWFDPFKPGTEFTTGQGWNTDRGRMYLIFGDPDELVFGGQTDMWLGGRNRASDNKYGMERWYYYDYGIIIGFLKDEHGKWKLMGFSKPLLDAMETAKLNMISPELRVDVKRMLEFRGEFKNNTIILRIPTKRILLDEKDEKLHSQLKVRVFVYRNHKRIDELMETISSSYTEDEISSMKYVTLEIPYSPSLKGDYLFDITLEDMMSMSFSRYRNFIKHKVRKGN
jgi:GWxTD domain-containing protein